MELEAETPHSAKRKGMASHERVDDGTDVWLTPPGIVRALGGFDLDPCSPSVRPWETASRYYTRYDNGLIQRWEGRVWMNPPYGDETKKWLARLAEHRKGIALIFARTETDAWHRWVWSQADAVFFFKGRITFCDFNGKPAKSPSGAPSALVAYGQENVLAIREAQKQAASPIQGKLIPL